MSFNNALSGVNAAQKDLNVTANNIANVNTMGFKESRAEFADVYANSIFVNAKTQVGNGVATGAVAHQFHQGALQFTNNALDLAIQGNGFFVTSDGLTNLDRTYTRAGAFKLNENSYMVNNQGHYLQGYEINTDGTPKAVSINATKPIQVPDRAGEPKMTELVEASFNLSIESKTKPTDPAAFDPTNSATFAHSTSVTIYDSLGAPHVITKYFVRHEDPVTPGTPMTPGTWSMYMYEGDKPIDIASGAPSPGPGIPTGVQMTFTSGGKLDPALTIPAPPAPIKTVTLGTAAGIINNGADPTQAVEIRLSDVTQYNSPFNVTKLTQDGATVGNLTKVEITPDGIVSATYSNATTLKVAMVALAKFANSQGLTQVGDTSWRQSLLSGDALPGTPNSGTLGSIKSSAVEQSNVDLTSQLVNLITAQRNFQANSRSLEVNSSLQQTILQIR
ncbi:flagellar hook protein FlgE [Aeromonas salmonicida subsp. salmonicida]|uniref:Flagellar hook protein FlgE n=3 Tax=Aeromonas salmonicida TaxID=645 RepID=A4SL12_AERS4|nr:flagellar hook protein FlgE [Aeromonas salmonicida]ABO89584.1 flagellar hook protein FlgE [Aeromonas salmonicida subsp. salmonicida A449]AYO62682.1 flagellar hook protein FlgE [Aeromonas salmonicida subsp. salmonicida 01-B526]EHI50616.1 flagellar hook protein FlgE [Aeromonas salmonicida subsp. salmonicida 01-B526]EKP0239876.1 flagellar hook protein FlgE [Aeromonas salmonicida]EKP0244059.1 flagellar hook protein FlgE [Aeromonas salmonicida]